MDQPSGKTIRVLTLLEQLKQIEKCIDAIKREENAEDNYRLNEYLLIREKVITKIIELLSN